jgi:excisionase family DNA binding protein
MPKSPDRPPARIEVVTIPVHDLQRYVEEAYASGYTRAAEERERIMADLAERLSPVALKDVLTTKEAAAYCNLSPKNGDQTVLAWIAEGLPATKNGARYLIRRDELDAWRTRAA